MGLAATSDLDDHQPSPPAVLTDGAECFLTRSPEGEVAKQESCSSKAAKEEQQRANGANFTIMRHGIGRHFFQCGLWKQCPS